MTTLNGVAEIQALDRKGLLTLWSQIVERQTPDWEPGKAFEHLVLRAFEIEGVDVRWPYQVKFEETIGEQIDGAIYLDGVPFLVESKDEIAKINFDPIAKLKARLARRPPFVMGVVFSTSGFTTAALKMAGYLPPPSVLLWEGPEFGRALKNRRMREVLRRKLRFAVEYGLPDYYYSEDGHENPRRRRGRARSGAFRKAPPA